MKLTLSLALSRQHCLSLSFNEQKPGSESQSELARESPQFVRLAVAHPSPRLSNAKSIKRIWNWNLSLSQSSRIAHPHSHSHNANTSLQLSQISPPLSESLANFSPNDSLPERIFLLARFLPQPSILNQTSSVRYFARAIPLTAAE